MPSPMLPVIMGESHIGTHGQHPVEVSRTEGYNDSKRKEVQSYVEKCYADENGRNCWGTFKTV